MGLFLAAISLSGVFGSVSPFQMRSSEAAMLFHPCPFLGR